MGCVCVLGVEGGRYLEARGFNSVEYPEQSLGRIGAYKMVPDK